MQEVIKNVCILKKQCMCFFSMAVVMFFVMFITKISISVESSLFEKGKVDYPS